MARMSAKTLLQHILASSYGLLLGYLLSFLAWALGSGVLGFSPLLRDSDLANGVYVLSMSCFPALILPASLGGILVAFLAKALRLPISMSLALCGLLGAAAGFIVFLAMLFPFMMGVSGGP